MVSGSLKAELDALRAELAALRKPEPRATGETAEPGGLEGHLAELNALVHQMLENAEETIAEHPVATVAGALALGIVIGRLTAR
jgi:ElaB/YqjD/DUF883 family membrane-anchored ribosome-binding protein